MYIPLRRYIVNLICIVNPLENHRESPRIKKKSLNAVDAEYVLRRKYRDGVLYVFKQ